MMKNIVKIDKAKHELWYMTGQIVKSEAYRTAKTATQNMPHPSADQLYAYLLDELDIEEARSIRTHLAYCSDCTDDMIAIMRIEDEEEQGENLSEISSAVELRSEYHYVLVENAAMEYWEPRYAGMELTAADMRPEPFQFQDGQITIKAFWEGARGDKPAYIWVGWEVRVQPPFHLHLRFIAPETGEILYEANLGQTTKDSESFSADEVHFDPTTSRFGIVAFTESPQ